MRRAVFLDRDGVLNRTYLGVDGITRPPSAVDQIEIEEGAVDACARLRRAGFLLIGVTNQPDVRRGNQREAVVHAINAHVAAQLGLDDILTCLHDSADDCPCRKPKPGMLLDAAERHGIDLRRSFMVGDRPTDIEAGKRADVQGTVFIGPAFAGPPVPTIAAPSLAAAADWILATPG